MRVADSLSMCVDAIRGNRLRASLTLVGIVAGVASIIAVMTAIAVVQSTMEREMSVLGAQTFQVQKWPAGEFISDEERRRSLTVIDQETRRLAQLVENVLQFSRGERGTLRLTRESTDVAALVAETVDAFLPIASARGTTIVTSLPAHEGERTLALPNRAPGSGNGLFDRRTVEHHDGGAVRDFARALHITRGLGDERAERRIRAGFAPTSGSHQHATHGFLHGGAGRLAPDIHLVNPDRPQRPRNSCQELQRTVRSCEMPLGLRDGRPDRAGL